MSETTGEYEKGYAEGFKEGFARGAQQCFAVLNAPHSTSQVGLGLLDNPDHVLWHIAPMLYQEWNLKVHADIAKAKAKAQAENPGEAYRDGYRDALQQARVDVFGRAQAEKDQT